MPWSHSSSPEKKTIHASEADTPRVKALIEEFEQEVAQIDPKDLIFIDEMGINTSMQRTHARAPQGERAVGTKPQKGKNISIIGAIGLEKGMDVVTKLPRGLNGALFVWWVACVLVPVLKPGQVVVMDNCSSHKVKGIKEIIEGAGCRVLYLPPYSPQFNPIEMAWSKIKALLRKAAQRTVVGLLDALFKGVAAVNWLDIDGWFSHAGYDLNQ